MKKYYLILLIVSTFSLIYLSGCNDSLGIDPNVEIIPVPKDSEVPDTTDTDVDDSTDTQKEVNNIIWNLQEIIVRKYPLKDTTINWEEKIIKNDIRIDTTERIYKIWMLTEMETTVPNSINPWRRDRVVRFSMNFKASLNGTLYYLNGDSKIGRELTVTIQDNHNGMRYNFKGYQIHSKIIFSEINKLQRTITGQIIVDFTKVQRQETRAFVANFTINY